MSELQFNPEQSNFPIYGTRFRFMLFLSLKKQTSWEKMKSMWGIAWGIKNKTAILDAG